MFHRFITGRNEIVAKVMFLLVSVILLTGWGRGVCLSACWIPPTTPHPTPNTPYPTPAHSPPPKAGPPQQADPQEADPPGSRHPPPSGKQTPAYGQWTAGTHPTGMHSCVDWKIFKWSFMSTRIPNKKNWNRIIISRTLSIFTLFNALFLTELFYLQFHFWNTNFK